MTWKVATASLVLLVIAAAPCPLLADDEADCETSAPGSGYRPLEGFCPAEDLRPGLFVSEESSGQDARRRALVVAREKVLRDPAVPPGAAAKLAERIRLSLTGFDGTCATSDEIAAAEMMVRMPECEEQPALSGLGEVTTGGGSDPQCECAWTVMSGELELCVPARSRPEAERWSDAQVDRVAGYVRLVAGLLGGLAGECIKKAAEDLRRYNRQWNNLVVSGYTQFPWEYFVNGWASKYVTDDPGEGRWGPSPNQWILLHPGAGVGFDGAGPEGPGGERRTVAVISIEAIGYLRYWTSTDFKFYWGVAAAATFNNLDMTDPSVGLVVHVSRWFHVGYSFGVVPDENAGRGTAFFLIDFANLVSENKRIGDAMPALLERFSGR